MQFRKDYHPTVYLEPLSSETIKGILIILIVLGHNHILCPDDVEGQLMEYLYTFHVAGFFILPFFYQNNNYLTWERISKTVVRNWIPYLWACLLCWVVYSLYQKHFEFGWGHVYAFLNGTQTPLHQYFGFVFPWFLPVYCSLSLLLMLAKKWHRIGLIVFLVGFGTFFMSWEQFYQFKNIIPFGIGLAINYFASGVLAFVINKYIPWGKYWGAIAFVSLSICWWMGISGGFLHMLYQLFPVSFFMVLLCIVPYINLKWLRQIGQYSLGIYLLHIFFQNAFYFYFPHTTIMGWMALFFSLLISLLLTMGIYRVNTIRKKVFPQNINDLKFL